MGDKTELSSYPEFQEILKKGIGDRKIIEFSADAGLPRTTVSRLLNSDVMNRPSITTIKKLSSAINYPVYADMLKACGYEMESLSDALNDHYAEVRQVIADVFSAGNVFLSKESAADKLQSVYDKGDVFRMFPGNEDNGTLKPALIINKWRFDKYDCKTYFGIIYSEDDQGKITIVSALYSLEELHASGMRNPEMKRLSLLAKQEDSIYFYKETMTTVFGIAYAMYNDKSQMNQMDRLMVSLGIIDKNRDFSSTWAGYGIPYEQVADHGEGYPEKIRTIMLKNREFICTTKENADIFQKIAEATNLSQDEMSEILENFHQDGADDNNLEEDQLIWGPGAVIAQILTGLTGQQFFCYDSTHGSNDGCIVFGKSFTDPPKPTLDTVKIVYEMAKAIGAPTFGLMYHTYHHLKPADSTYYTESSHIEYPSGQWMLHLDPIQA